MTTNLAVTAAPDAAEPAAVVRSVAELRALVAQARSVGARIGLVPTMGALHEGHLSLIDRARSLSDWTVVSIFVNPLQFGAGEDLDRYPRDLDGDVALASSRGADAVFAPAVAEMYPGGAPQTLVTPGSMAERLCGASRPGHFQGVLTVVAKLFGIVAPDVAVFGNKDYQQARLIERMVADLNMPVRIDTVATVREADGLALSSRNRYLSAAHRTAALGLAAGLGAAQGRFASGERDPNVLGGAMRAELRRSGAEVEYAEIVDPNTLQAVSYAFPGAACVIAARVGGVRLIDNATLRAPFPDQS